MRVVVSAYDLGAISSGETSSYDYDFPRPANHYFNATFISNEKDIFYKMPVFATRGSPWTRGNNLNRGKLKLKRTNPFEARSSIAGTTMPPTAGGVTTTASSVTCSTWLCASGE